MSRVVLVLIVYYQVKVKLEPIEIYWMQVKLEIILHHIICLLRNIWLSMEWERKMVFV